MPFLNDLLNAGIHTGDAQILEQEFPNEPGFLDGLELVARAMVTRDPGLIPPQGAPWADIHHEMLFGGLTLENALSKVLSSWSPSIQVAVMGALTTRQADLQTWWDNIRNTKARKTQDYLRVLGMLGYEFKINQCRQELEVNGKPMTDTLAQKIRSQLRDAGIHDVWVAEDAYGGYAYDHRYHPVKDYLMSLQWDGGKYIDDLSSHFADVYNVFGLYLRKWLIGCVARTLAREQNRMFVLDGKQGIGKDYFVKWLASPLYEYYYEGPIVPDDKDHRVRLMHTWVWNANELGNTTRKQDREALKAFLTLEWVRIRKPYGRFDVQGPALASFFGTANDESGLLNDPTGSRRFMITKLLSIDWGYTRMDASDVWAEAYAAYIAGENWRLDGADLDRSNEINEAYQMVDMVEETIKALFEIDSAEKGWILSTKEIMDVLKDPTKGNLRVGAEIDTRRLASALTHLGLDKAALIKSQGIAMRCYRGIRHKGP